MAIASDERISERPLGSRSGCRVQFHIEARTDELIAKGATPEDAAREARRHFGNRLLLRESSRDAKLISWLESVLQDLRFGLRMLRKNVLVTAAAVLSLSLAIGACAAAFSLIDSFFLRPLPVRDPSRLVYLLHSDHEYGSDYDTGGSWALLDHLAEASRRQIDLFGLGWANLWSYLTTLAEMPERLELKWISGDGFRILGIQPALGRVLTAGDDGHAVAVLSYTLWTHRFGANPNVLGRWFNFDGKSFQIVGVTQKGFSSLFRGYRTDLLVSETERKGWVGSWYWEF